MKNAFKRIKTLLRLFFICGSLLGIPQNAEAKCPTGGFAIIDTLFSICWECMFPITISGITIINGPMNNQPMLSGARQPLCTCPMPPPIFMRIGIPVGFFEADWQRRSVKPFVFQCLDFKLPIPLKVRLMARKQAKQSKKRSLVKRLCKYIGTTFLFLRSLRC